MVEVDPMILIAVAAAIVAIVVFATYSKSSTVIIKEAPTPVSTTKPKKKSKSSKSKSSGGTKTKNGKSETPAVSNTKTEAAKSVAEPVNVKSAPIPEPEPEDDVMPDPPVTQKAAVEEVKKSKKAKETPEQKASRLERQKLAKSTTKPAEKQATTTTKPPETVSPYAVLDEPTSPVNPPQFDGWAVVEDKRKVKGKKGEGEDFPVPEVEVKEQAPAAAAPPVEEAPPAPVVETVTTVVKVDAKKIGLLIGPKGVTKIAIQNVTGCEITMPKVEKDFVGSTEVSITGTSEGVKKAEQAINELCNKGYCTLIAGDDFHEGYVAINPKHLPDIIGKGGSCIKALQAHTGVKISIPPGISGAKAPAKGEPPLPKIKVNLAGPRDKITLARNLILELIKYYHTTVTHPGVVHLEMDVPGNYYNYIIGAKGSEIRHIQANYKVNVYIPNAESQVQNVLIVGEEHNVQQAERHIINVMKKVDQAAEDRAKYEAERIATAQSLNYSTAAIGAKGDSPTPNGNGATNGKRGGQPPAEKKAPPVNPEDAWMSEFAPKSSKIPMDLGAMLPKGVKLSAAQNPAAAPAGGPGVEENPPLSESKKEEGGSTAPSVPSAWNNGSIPITAETW